MKWMNDSEISRYEPGIQNLVTTSARTRFFERGDPIRVQHGLHGLATTFRGLSCKGNA